MENKIKNFANQMQSELDSNTYKGNWEDFKDVEKIIVELEYHKAKLFIAIKDDDKEKIMEYSADCANNLMFLTNAFGLLESDDTDTHESGISSSSISSWY